MKTNQRHVKRASIKPYLLATSAIGLLSVGLTTTASAQEAKNQPKDENIVVVTGIRKGIQDSISAKKKSLQIIESVSAEDIGKLPDNSIAESIARLPGIAAQRTNGRAQTLSIRGLGPDYTVTTLNGREQASTNDNRSVEFDQYPGELISQVKVFKTPNASMPTQGIAGTADLETVRPLSYGKRTFAFGYKREENDKSALVGGTSNTGDRYTATYIDQYLDGKVGLALGYAKTTSPYQNNRWEAWGYTNNFYHTGNSIADGVKPITASGELDREGYMGVLEFKPNDQWHLTFDGYHSDFSEKTINQRIEFPLFNPANNGNAVGSPAGWDGSTILQSYTASNGIVTSATYTGVKTVVGNYVSLRDAKVDSLGANAQFDTKAGWKLAADASYSKVDRTDLILETTAGTGPNGSGALDTVTIKQDSQTGATISTTIDYSDFNNLVLTDARGWGGSLVSAIGGQTGYVHKPHVVDELKTLKLSATKDLNNKIFKDIEFGLNHTERSKDKTGTEGYLSIATGATSAPVPTQFRTGVTDLSWIGITKGIISYDALGLYNSGFYRYTENTYPDAVKSTWRVEEKVDTFYAMANIDSDFMGVPVTGNLGVQAQMADQSAFSQYSASSGYAPKSISGNAKYTDVLPSLNLTFSLPQDVLLRFAAAQTISRPRMDQIQVGSTYSYSSNSNGSNVNGHTYYWSGSGGNVGLEPWKANAFDISAEKYFGRKGYVSLALFYKDLTSYIYNSNKLVDFAALGYGFNGSDATSSNFSLAAANTTGYFSTQQNGKGGHIQGVEASVSVPLELVSSYLDGFGVIVSGTANESKINPAGTAVDLPGLSKHVVNATVYFEKWGFSARVSQRYRSDFVGEVPDYTNVLSNTWVHSERIVDAQLGYNFSKGMLNGLSINLSGSNLTDVPFYTYSGKGNKSQVLRYEKYGPTYSLSVNYKF